MIPQRTHHLWLVLLALFLCGSAAAQPRKKASKKTQATNTKTKKVSNQLIGIVPTEEGRKDPAAFQNFLQQQGITLQDTLARQEGDALIRASAPGAPDPAYNNGPLAVLRRNTRLVRWAGVLQQNSLIETGQITIETESPEAAVALKKQLPASILSAQLDGRYLIATVQPQIGSGIQEVAKAIGAMGTVRYVEVNRYPGTFLKD